MNFQNGMAQALDPLRLRLLVEVERRGSISAAADACRIGQPSATKHLKTLEGAVGEPLLRREGRGSTLTDAGRVVADHASQMLGSLAAMEDELRALRGGETGVLTLAASTTPGTYVLPSVLKCFAERHPGVDVTMSIGPSAEVMRQVATREVQLGIAGEIQAVPTVAVEPFLDDELVGIVAPGTFAAEDVRAEELAGHTLLVRERGSSTRATADRHLSAAGVRPAKTWELDSNEAIKRAVAAGLGVGFVSRLVVEDELEQGRLSSFRIAGGATPSRPIQLLRAHDRHLTPSERAFITTLTDCCDATVPACVVDMPA
ncbi:MAG: LysR substrate-binding domain-containing protein [Thermoleophilaceae bacterium]